MQPVSATGCMNRFDYRFDSPQSPEAPGISLPVAALADFMDVLDCAKIFAKILV